jgi:hypothetical protein
MSLAHSTHAVETASITEHRQGRRLSRVDQAAGDVACGIYSSGWASRCARSPRPGGRPCRNPLHRARSRCCGGGHRHRWRGRRLPADCLDCSDRTSRPRAGDPVSYRVLLDPAAFLGLGAQSSRRLQASEDPSASSRCRRGRNTATNSGLHFAAATGFIAALAAWLSDRVLRNCGGCKRRRHDRARTAIAAGQRSAKKARKSSIRLLHLLPGFSVRRAAH